LTTQVLAGDTTNKMAFLGGEEGAALCIALLCTIVLRRRLSSKKRSTWARCCTKMAGKEETPKCRKKTVTRTNEMIEDLIDFIEIHPMHNSSLSLVLLSSAVFHIKLMYKRSLLFLLINNLTLCTPIIYTVRI
jgi:hypothetical protein